MCKVSHARDTVYSLSLLNGTIQGQNAVLDCVNRCLAGWTDWAIGRKPPLTKRGVWRCWVMRKLWMQLFLLTTISAFAADQVISRPPTGRQSTNDYFARYTAASFAKLAPARQTINPDAVNVDLLDAAVFHETNRRRQQSGLPPLKHSDKARATARLQSRAMAKGGFVDHENPDPKMKTMEDRARLAGIKPRVLAENVASAFGRRYKSGRPFYTREQSGRRIYSYEPDGPPIPMHTYLSFAEALVESWMKSPGHRKNILHTEPEYLGCACELPRNANAMETFYCTQVFFAHADSAR